MRLVFLIDPALQAYGNRIRYVLDFLKRHPLVSGVELEVYMNPTVVPDGSKILSYGNAGDHESDWNIPAQQLVFNAQKIDYKTFEANVYDFEDLTCYSVEPRQKTAQPFTERTPGGAIRFNFDWIETLFFHLSRCEEYRDDETPLDEHGNCLESALFLPRQNLHQVPVVDHLVRAILQALGVKTTPRPTRFTLTHDVDSLRLFSTFFQLFRFLAGRLLRDRTTEGLVDTLKAYFRHRFRGEKDPYDTFDWLLTGQNRFEKIVYFPSGVRRERRDPAYALEDPKARAVLELALSKNYRIGIHPGYLTWRNPAFFEDDVRRLQQWAGRPIRHTRQHFLHFHFPDTLNLIEAAGLEEDSTLGYRTLIGFRCGTGFPFYPYNFEKETAYPWKENPPAVMDVALLREAGFNPERVHEMWRNFLKTNEFGTHLTVLFHNSIFFQPAACGHALRKIYEDFVSP